MSRGSHISAYALSERHKLPGYGGGYRDRIILEVGTERASCPILACYEVYLFLSFPQKHPAWAVVRAAVCSTGMPAWPRGLLPSRGACALPVPALGTRHIALPGELLHQQGTRPVLGFLYFHQQHDVAASDDLQQERAEASLEG